MSVAILKQKWSELSSGRKRALKGVTGAAIGALAGFAYYYFVGCSTGSCPITSDPLISTGWGAMIGAFWALG